MRTIVSPVFTSGKLRLMVPHIDKCGDNMEDVLRTAAVTGEVLEGKEMYGKFTLDSIATSGFGIESNSFKDPENLFRINALKLVRWDFTKTLFIPTNIYIVHFQRPKVCFKIGVLQIFSPRDVSQTVKVSWYPFLGQKLHSLLRRYSEENN